jgi:hypothetical protein
MAFSVAQLMNDDRLLEPVKVYNEIEMFGCAHLI